MKTFSVYTVSALLFLAFGVNAQSENLINGKWVGAAKSPSTGSELQIQVSIKDSSGTWIYVAPPTARSPCLGREFPLVVRHLQGSKFQLSVDGASLITGCPKFVVTVDQTDENTLSGAFGDGRPALLKRQ